MTDKEIFFNMLEMQKTYDQKVFAAHGISGYDEIYGRIFNALLDEIGELNHELKGEWCWWKNTQKPVNREKVLEEFADVVHFCLCLLWARPAWSTITRIDEYLEEPSLTLSLEQGMRHLVDGLICEDPVRVMVAGKEMLDLTWEDIYRIYCAKHNINLERVSNGY